MKKIFFLLPFLLFSFFPAHAYADYVMPYPGMMPGNKLYKVSEVIDGIEGWWSFGNLAQFSYQLKMADKKLIEAKTLFEYKQYLLASKAVPVYEYHLAMANNALIKATSERKNVSVKRALFLAAVSQHKQILEQIRKDTPQHFFWQPEKGNAQMLEIHKMLDSAIEIGGKLGQEKND